MPPGVSGKNILVIEDEYFIASDLRRALEKAEANVVGPIGNLAGGRALARQEPIDAAVLDVNLEGAHSYEIADDLAARGIPFLFLTGYNGWALPEAYRDAPRISKPCPLGTVMRAIEALVMTGRPA